MEAFRGDYWSMSMEKNGYTVDDILALPEGQRAELYDGEMVMLAAPTTTHQALLSWLHVEISLYVRKKGGNCLVLPAPYGVFIKNDKKNYFEPDISVICNRDRVDEQGCHGAPDWILEIISPSSRKYDCGRKLATYIEAGVREYWIVDAERKLVLVYCLEQPDIPVIYPFGETIKVGIYEDLEISIPQELY